MPMEFRRRWEPRQPHESRELWKRAPQEPEKDEPTMATTDRLGQLERRTQLQQPTQQQTTKIKHCIDQKVRRYCLRENLPISSNAFCDQSNTKEYTATTKVESDLTLLRQGRPLLYSSSIPHYPRDAPRSGLQPDKNKHIFPNPLNRINQKKCDLVVS